MAITDELREYANIATDRDIYAGARLCKIADRIDAEHRSALEKLAAQVDETSDMREFCGRIEQAANNREDVTIWGVDYVPLPVDADGVPIHVGDRLEHVNGAFTANDMTISIDGIWRAWDGENGHTVLLAKCHHRAPTVEDVLREFADRYLDYEGIPSAGRRGVGEALMDEYAAKLRLAEEVDE